jgi:hypothetical protein
MEDGDPRSISRAAGEREAQRTKSHGVADLLLHRSKIDTPFSRLLTCIDSTRKRIHLDIRNLRYCVVRAVGGISIALDEGQLIRARQHVVEKFLDFGF